MCQRNCQQLIIKLGINAGNYYAVAVRMKSLWKCKHPSMLTLVGRKKRKRPVMSILKILAVQPARLTSLFESLLNK